MSEAGRYSRRWSIAVVGALSLIAACRGGDELDTVPTSLAKATPRSVSVTDAWTLFDRSTSSGFVPGTEPIHIELDHAVQVSAIKIAGAAPYRVHATANGSSIGFSTLDLSTSVEAWRTYPS